MKDNNKNIIIRIGLVYYFVLIFALVIVGRIVYLQFAEKEKWSQKALSLTEKTLIIEPSRGDICAIDGRLLSTSVPYYEVRIDMKAQGLTKEVFDENIDSLCYNLSAIFADRPANDYKRELVTAKKRGSRYHLLKRKVSYLELKKLKKCPLLRLGQNKGGFIYIQSNKRAKPFLDLASRTIGFLHEAIDGKKDGFVGVESAYNHELKGVQGLRLMQRISGNIWMPINDENAIEPKDGNDVFTTIDVNFQDVAQNALYNQLSSHKAASGCVVLMEVATGAIKAIANLERDSSGYYRETYNYAIGASTEPGSTFKLVSLIVALEDGKFDLNDSVDTENGTYKFYDRTMKDSHQGGYGKISVKDVFALSSNVGISKLITKHYKGNESHFVDRLYKMNLNEKLNISIKGEGKPYIKYPGDSSWYGTTLPWMSVGYETRLTPLQILTFYNAIANNGKMVKPLFVKRIMYHGETLKEFDTEVINPSICSDETLEKAKIMLEAVVDYGTARNLKNSIYKIAGKTGTAQIADKKFGYKVNAKVNYQASFVGYFPADNPKYSCIVVVNSPSNNVYYGNVVAGPVFKEISDRVYASSLDIHNEVGNGNQNLVASIPATKFGKFDDMSFVFKNLNIKADYQSVKSEWVVADFYDSLLVLKNRYIKEKSVPNVIGMGAKDAVYLLENAGLKVRMIGKGKVIKQSIDANSPITNKSIIEIELKS